MRALLTIIDNENKEKELMDQDKAMERVNAHQVAMDKLKEKGSMSETEDLKQKYEDLLKQHNNLRDKHYCLEQSHNDYYRVLSETTQRLKEVEKMVEGCKKTTLEVITYQNERHARQIDENRAVSGKLDELENSIASTDNSLAEEIEDNVGNYIKLRERIEKIETVRCSRTQNVAEDEFHQAMVQAMKQYGLAISNLAKK